MSKQKLLSVSDVAERYGIPKTRLYALVRNQAIPHIRMGHTIYFQPESLNRWLDGSEVGA